MENAMKVGFVFNRSMRKTLRLATRRPAYNTAHTDLTETLRRDACLTDDVLLQNLEFLDRDYGHDEFKDIDNEYEGLTITEPMDEVEQFKFCTGYDVI
jgi:hypothetical protein